MCVRDHLLFIPDPCCSPFLRLQLLRKERSFLHVIWVTNNGRAWEGAGWETLPIRPNAIHPTDSRDGGAAGEWQQEHHHHRCRPRGAGRCAPLLHGKEAAEGINFSSSPGPVVGKYPRCLASLGCGSTFSDSTNIY